MRAIVALLLTLALAGQSGNAWAEPASHESRTEQAAYGAGSAVGTLLYTPLKAGFCVLGGIASVFAFVFAGGPEATRVVASASCKGTWVLTPDALKGNEPINFVGDAAWEG